MIISSIYILLYYIYIIILYIYIVILGNTNIGMGMERFHLGNKTVAAKVCVYYIKYTCIT